MIDSPIENPIPAEAQETDSPPPRAFEDLSLAEVLVRLILHPGQTWIGLRETLGRLPEDRRPMLVPGIQPALLSESATAQAEAGQRATPAREPFAWRPLALPLVMGGLALVALLGSFLVDSDAVRRSAGFPLGAILMVLAAAAMAETVALGRQMKRLPPLGVPGAGAKLFDLEALLAAYGLRLAVMGGAVVLSAGAWLLNGDNRFTPLGVLCWGLSIVAWVIVFAPQQANLLQWIGHRWRRLRVRLRHSLEFRWSWTAAALIVILLAGGWFRFNNLSAYPPDMTSDHVEKLLDTVKVLNGATTIFFPNNGGRESFQMYYLAVLHQLTGIPISFDLLKIGSGLEGMLMILLAWWMGRAIFGEEDRKLGNLVGLIMAAMLATSYWHTMLSRLGLRIVLTTLAITVVFVFLARALRHNRRADYLFAGLVLGASTYFYQAMRMTPLIVIIGLVLALIFRVRSWRVFWRYLLNFVALTVVAIAVFIPLANYMFYYPGSFWERTGGRFFGADTAPILDSRGNVIGERLTTPEERLQAFEKNIPVFADNLRKTAWMFNIRGDNAWVTGDPGGSPELDIITGAFFVLGLGVVAVRMFRRRDPVDWLLPAGIAIMVLPSALSIAFPIEVPSASRASGALPFVLLVAALGMAVVAKLFAERIPSIQLGHAVSIGIIVLVSLGALARLMLSGDALPLVFLVVVMGLGVIRLLFGGELPRVRLRHLVYGVLAVGLVVSALLNADTYFNVAMAQYRDSTFPYHQAGTILRGFSQSTGASGNAFMVGWHYGWDHRAVGIESGDPSWNNGVVSDNLIARITGMMVEHVGTPYEVRPDRQLMFFLGLEDTTSLTTLQDAFPGGSVITVESFTPRRNFNLYVAPPPGCAWVEETLKYEPLSCVEQPGG